MESQEGHRELLPQDRGVRGGGAGGRGFAWLLVGLVIANVGLMALFKLGDYDIWYHLAAGRHIIQSGRILHNDPFSYTAADRPWSVQSWLAGVIFYGVHTLGGVGGLIVVNAAVIALAFTLVLLNMRESRPAGRDLVLAVALTLLAAATARLRFMVRPHGLEFLLLAAQVLIIERHRRGLRTYLPAVPLLQALWVNVHGSFILGLIVPLLYLAGEVLQRLLLRSDGRAEGKVSTGRSLGVYSALLLANAVATLVNPVTWRAYALPFLILGQETYMRSIGEWQSFRWSHLVPYNLRYTGGFILLGLLAVAGFVRNRRRIDVTDVLLASVFFILAMRGIRLMAEFAIIVAPVVFRAWRGALPAGLHLRGAWTRAVLLALLLIVLPLVITRSPTYAFGLGVKEDRFPIRACDFIERNGIDGVLFNSFAFGDYLCWRIAPGRRVYIHGRNDVFPESFFSEYTAARDSAEGWRGAVDKHGITYALIQYVGSGYDGMHRNAHLADDPEWVPVYWDMTAVVYVRDIPANRGIIERHGYRLIRPENFSLKYLTPLVAGGQARRVTAELDRLIRVSPANEEAYIARGSVAFIGGGADVGQAERDLKAALALNPARSLTHTALGMVYQEQGRRDDALRSYEKALQLNPDDKLARGNRDKLLAGAR